MTRREVRRVGVDRILEKKRRPARRLVAAIGGALGLAVVAVAFLAGGADGRRVRVRAEHLGIATVERGLFQEWIAVTGTVVPVTTHCLDAVAGGRVEEIFREAGSMVSAGDPIMKLANADLRLDTLAREAELLQRANEFRAARAAMEQNGLALCRELLELDLAVARQQRLVTIREKLLESGLIARQTVEEAREELDCLSRRRTLAAVAQSQDSLFRAEQAGRLAEALERMQANVAAVRGSLEDLVLRAPVAGQLTALDAQIGQSLAGGERVGQIDVLDGFRVRAVIGEHYVARIVAGLPGQAELAGTVHDLIVEKVYPEVTGGRFEIDLRFTHAEPLGLRRGQTLSLRLELGEAADALLLACGAFLQDTGGRWVFVVDPAGRSARRRAVTLGRRNGVSCEVLDGLRAGERVVISPYETFAGADRLVLRP